MRGWLRPWSHGPPVQARRGGPCGPLSKETLVRRAAGILSVVGIASALLLVGVPAAQAVEPPPPPVGEMGDIPSKYANYYNPSSIGPPGSPSYEEWSKAMDEWIEKEYIARGASNPYVKPPATVTVPNPTSALGAAPKPLTMPSVLARAAGVPLMVLTTGWAVAANGTIALIAYESNDGEFVEEFTEAYCQNPDWYEGVTKFVSLGFGPECVGPVESPNADIPADEFSNASYGGFAVTYTGTCDAYATPSWGYTYTGTVPSGYSVLSTNGYGPLNASGSGTCDVFGSSNRRYIYQFVEPNPALRIIDLSTGAVVSEMLPLAGNPLRQVGCTIDWEDGTTTSGEGTPYTEEDGLPLTAEGLGCSDAYQSKSSRGPAMLPERIRVTSTPESGDPTVISDQEVPAFTEDERESFGTGNGHGLELKKVVAGVASSCMTWEAVCVDWWEDTDSGTSPITDDGTYQCTYGGTLVALTQCSVYQTTFQTRTSTPVITDPTTGTETDWVTAPVTGGAPSSPGSANSTNPANSISPGDACFESWPPFNLADPITWVMHPVYCAIVKAFAPRQSVVDLRFAEAAAVWDTKAPAALIEAAGSIDGMTGPTGCSIPITIFGVTADVVNVCSGSLEQLPIYTRFITGAYAVIVVFTKLRQQTAAMVNYNVGQT